VSKLEISPAYTNIHQQPFGNISIQKYDSEAMQSQACMSNEIQLSESFIEREFDMFPQQKMAVGECGGAEEMENVVSYTPEQQQHQQLQQMTEFYYTTETDLVFREQNIIYPSIYLANSIEHSQIMSAYSLPSINTVLN